MKPDEYSNSKLLARPLVEKHPFQAHPKDPDFICSVCGRPRAFHKETEPNNQTKENNDKSDKKD